MPDKMIEWKDGWGKEKIVSCLKCVLRQFNEYYCLGLHKNLNPENVENNEISIDCPLKEWEEEYER